VTTAVTTARNHVHLVMPASVRDPGRPSGGNVYDIRVCRGLASAGWSVHECLVPGAWPLPDPAARGALATVLADVPSGAVVLIDGLLACCSPDLLEAESDRLRLVVLVHMPLGQEVPGLSLADGAARERVALGAASAIVTTSAWARRWLLDRYAVPPDRVYVAEPGTDLAEPAPGTPGGGRLLCVGAVAPHKGHDVLVEALAQVRDLSWRCVCVGALDVDPGFVERVRGRARDSGVEEALELAGPMSGPGLDAAYSHADLLVLASRTESFGMVVTEALARGLPVLATAVGGVPETLGWSADGHRPGVLVPTDDPAALGGALRRWLADPGQRQALRTLARARRARLPSWSVTTTRVASVLTGVVP
jgi:glycosyltransferase involved in cell wall biosynthesis